MSKKTKKQRKDTRTYAEKEEHANEAIRAICTNWDKLPVRISRGGEKHACLNRKVVCKGIHRIEIPEELFREIQTYLRAGYEIRLTHAQEDIERIFPLLLKGMKEAIPVSKLTPAVYDTFAGMLFDFYTKGERLSEENGLALEKQQRSRNKSYKENRIEVTPDTMVECPNCGTKFRIGRRIAAED